MPASIEADVCVIGSGFGGTLAALPFVEAGRRVVMIERGGWVERGPQNWAPDATGDNTPFYNFESPYLVLEGGNQPQMGAYHIVGGPSVFYGAVSLRFREADFEPLPQIVGDSGAAWPFGYDELAPWYDRAEALLDIAGTAGADPTEPPRATPYPQPSAPLADVTKRIGDAASQLGLQPFPLPLAINYRPGERQCRLCPTCDTYACAVSAKNDLASTLIPRLMRQGMLLLPNQVVVCLKTEKGRVTTAEIVDRTTGERRFVRAAAFVLAAGALGSPLLALASRLERHSPAPDVIGAYLMRHVNAIVFGLFPRLPGRLDTFHKQLGIHDFYFGHPAAPDIGPKAGALQQIHSPPVALVEMHLPRGFGRAVSPLARRMTGLLAIAEDQPQTGNRVEIGTARDRFGLPQLEITHRYTERDRRALLALAGSARGILRHAGARIFYTHHIRTFSHASGTLRMGAVPERAPVDADGRFRGLDNLLVTDASVFPTSAAVNPSLTIAALALRAATKAVDEGWPA